MASIFLFYCKFLTSELLYLFPLQSSKTTPEGRQAPAQKTQHFHISHTESRNSQKLWPRACSLPGDLLQKQHHQSGDNGHGSLFSLAPLSQWSPHPILAQHTHIAEGSNQRTKYYRTRQSLPLLEEWQAGVLRSVGMVFSWVSHISACLLEHLSQGNNSCFSSCGIFSSLATFAFTTNWNKFAWWFRPSSLPRPTQRTLLVR